MQYILSESEYAALQSRIADLESTNSAITAELLKAGHKLDVAAQVREADRQQLADLATENQTYCNQLAECKRDMDGMSKALAEAKSHEESLRKAWTEALDGKNRLFAEANNLRDQLAYFQNLAGDRYDRLQKVMEERNALQASLEKAQSRIEHSEHISDRRLRLANELQRTVRHLKNERVCIVINPDNGHHKVVSVSKADTYRSFGWVLYNGGEEFLVDRPA